MVSPQMDGQSPKKDRGTRLHHNVGCHRGPRLLSVSMLALCAGAVSFGGNAAWSAPFTPANDAQILAELPPGIRHAEPRARQLATERIDVALPLAQFYIQRARASGDLRFLGYAEAVLSPWLGKKEIDPGVLVLHATLLQSRHEFAASLRELDRALAIKPGDAQAWLTKATVLRVLGRFDDALAACEQLVPLADPAVATLCRESLHGLTGQLDSAYAKIAALNVPGLPAATRAWRASELGEMAVRQGDAAKAEGWFRQGLEAQPNDFYTLAAYADLLLRQRRAAEVGKLLAGRESMEPLLLRLAIADGMLSTPSPLSRARLSEAFASETRRGDVVHRREQARFLLDVEHRPAEALAAARQNWQVQREPDDILVFVLAAEAAGNRAAADPAWTFVGQHGLQDARLEALRRPGR